ncbi:MAG: glutamine-hydrolyzing carbamoyl-phosphate synthase small subunit [Candidatus Altiarchaeota archaeon]|nr:glutamine-hydrolyzing carbamoyl-phosphate synthase small subunit [Candidatus Altiarchaeota archaeon]
MDGKNAVLVLQDGTVIQGKGFGAKTEVKGEVVFNTSVGGYQEALTDPSYKGQILMMTYPLMGNYGINGEDSESDRIQAEGLIIRELSKHIGHHMAEKTLDEFLKDYSIPGMEGIDTRALTRKIRVHGTLNGILKYPYEEKEIEELKEKAEKLPNISELDLVSQVSTKEPKNYNAKGKKTIALLDCGVKKSIIQCLLDRRVNVIQVPAKTSANRILEYEPSAVLVSNGPGDPERADYVVETVKKLISEETPMFGICLGLQILALAFGARTYKLKFGHRGANQPVKDLVTGRAHITSQNHGFAVDAESMPEDIIVTHTNLNDGSVEGLTHKELPIKAVQYHPEAHPGPWYNYYLFDEFIEMIG